MRELVTYAAISGLVLGIGLASVYQDLQFDVWFLLCLSAALLAVGLYDRSSDSSRYVIAVGVLVAAAAFGVWRTEFYAASLAPATNWPEGEEFTFTGTVVQEPDEREATTHLYVASADTTLLVTTGRYAEARYGDRVKVTGTIERPTSFETELGRTFDYRGYLEARGVTHRVSFAEVAVLSQEHGNPVIATLLTVKGWFLESIEANLPEPQAGLAQGLLLGVKRALGDELEEAFRSTGIIHIVVLSGYNIMLVVAFVLYVLALVLPWRGRMIVGIAAIIGFALMVGLSATVVRASIMAALALVARAFGRTYDVVRALVVAGLVMLLINPYLLVYDTGFQLSFMATLGLILAAPLFEVPLGRVPQIFKAREFLIATLATQLFVWPILLYQIGEFSVVAVPVNVLVLPMVPVAMLATFVLVLVSSVSAVLATPLVWLAYASLTYIVAVPSWFASLPFASFVVPPFPFWVVIIAYGLLGYGVYRWYRPAEVDPLRDWVIEDEESLTITQSTNAPNRTSETPVFFR